MTIDASQMAELKNLLGDSYAGILDHFLKDSQIYMQTIENAIANDNRTAVSDAAHKLTSSSGQFGFMKLYTLAKQIERDKTLQGADLIQAFERLEAAYTEVLDYLRAEKLDA